MSKNKKKNWVSWLMRNYRLTFMLLGLLLVYGLFALQQMPKAEFPDMVIRQGVVVAVYPGATSEEVEQQVARPLERYLFTFKEVKRAKTTSESRAGMCFMMVELEDDVRNADQVWSKIKHGLNTFKSSLPSGVLALVCQDDFGDTSALLIAVESDSRTYRELHHYADDLGDELRRIRSVSNVRVYGDIPEQITLYVDHQRLSAYGISDKMLLSALQSNGTTLMSGQIAASRQSMPIHVSTTASSEEELGQQIIYTDPQGHVVRVRDVARIEREYDRSTSYIEQEGHPCILISAEMRSGNNIVQYGKEVNEVLERFMAEQMPSDVKITRIADQPKVVEKSVTDFLRDLVLSMVIIVLVMMVLFPLRTAIVAAITIPLTTFISVGIMHAAGIPLNTCSLAALVLVLGMIVDNSIVVLDGYLEYLDRGMSRWHAAARSAQQYFMPMLTATACICLIFFPFLITFTGPYGDFIKVLPWTILINLMVGLALSVMVIPVLEVWLIKKKGQKREGSKREKPNITDHVQRIYNHVLRWTFRHPWLTICGGIGIVTASLALAPFLKLRAMPYADRDQFCVEIFLPEGSGLAETREVTDSICRALHADERVTYITTFMGCASPRFLSSYAPQQGGKNFAQLIVGTHSAEESIALVQEFDRRYAEHFPQAFVKFKRMDYQLWNTHEFRFYGSDLDSLHHAAEQLMAHMRQNPNLENVRADFEHPTPVCEVTLDPVTAAQLGINKASVSIATALLTSDVPVTSVWEDNYELPVVMKAADCSEGLSCVANLPVKGTTPLRQVADVHPEWKEQRIVHRNGVRCISITAETRPGILPAPIEKELERYIASMSLPQGVRWELGGVEETNNVDLFPMILRGTAMSMAIIFFFLLFSFRRYGLAIVSIMAIGLAVPGMIVGLLLMNRMLGLTAIFGIVTLMGIIMRNEILIFEHADQCRRHGMSVRDAAFDAGRRRMVPIFLTTATTAVGVVPMIVAGTNFWMPVGVSIFAGGIGALILVVTVLPVAYWKLYDEPSPSPLPSRKGVDTLAMNKTLCLVALALCSFAAQPLHAQSLDSLKTAAIQHNRTLESARIDVKMAREDRRQAFTNYFPTIQAMGGVFQGFHPLMQADMELPPMQMMGMNIPLPPMSISEIKKGALVNLAAVQPVFAGGQIVNGNRLAKLQEEVRQLQLRMSERDVVLQVERLYWQIVSLQSSLGTLDAVDRQLAEVHKLTSSYVDAGLTTRNDLLRVELKQQETQSSRLQLTNGIALSRMALSQLCGVDSVQIIPEMPEHPEVPEVLEAQARLEAQLLSKSVDAAALQVKMERGKLLPSAGIGIADVYYNMMAKNVNNGVIFATVSVPISSWWGGTHAVRKAKLARQQAENDRQDALEKLALDNASAWNNLQEAAAQIAIARKSIESAAENLRMSMDQYRAGTLPLTDLLDAQTLHQQATDHLTETQATYQIRLAEWRAKN